MDSRLSFEVHVNEKCKIAFLHIRNIRSIRRFISDHLCNILVTSLVNSQIDYCNVILYGISECELKKLQRVQNAAAKLVLNRKRFDSATAALRDLGWLPMRYRIKFRIAVTVFKCLHNKAPVYLQELLHVQTPSRSLRSNVTTGVIDFKIPFCKRATFYNRSFAVSGPTVWNGLPSNIRLIPTIDSFKKELKTHMCTIAYNS